MIRVLLALVAALGTTASASAQQPPTAPAQPYSPAPYFPQQYIPPQNIQPNIYNPANQPLSPYLNFNRNNLAVNYFYGVRPGTTGGFGLGLGAAFIAPGGNRPLFFPQLANSPDPFQSFEAGVGDVLPSAGHAVVYNNTLGFFPSPYGNRGTTRNGLAGVGTAGKPPAQR